MPQNIYDFSEYHDYLSWRLPTRGEERGSRSALARKLRCQPAFITQVLKGRVHTSVEHAIAIDRFLRHSVLETQYFMLLVYKGRAGTHELKSFYQQQIDLLLSDRAKVSKRVNAKSLSAEATHRFYSSWVYAAVHNVLMIPGMTTSDKIAARLGLTNEQVFETLDFLVSIGMAEQSGKEYKTGIRRTHLRGDSSTIGKHHSNWRMRAIHSLDSKNSFNLHYSGPLALSKANAEKIRQNLLAMVESFEPIIAAPGEEECYVIALDFFVL